MPIVVAVNKIDKCPVPTRRRSAASSPSSAWSPEEYGGDTMFVDISAKQSTCTSTSCSKPCCSRLTLSWTSAPTPTWTPVVPPSKPDLDKGRGAVATVLVQQGTLHVGDAIVAGTSYGRVRAMLDENGQPMEAAGPSTPVAGAGLDLRAHRR